LNGGDCGANDHEDLGEPAIKMLSNFIQALEESREVLHPLVSGPSV
jgi:hypothetical protein